MAYKIVKEGNIYRRYPELNGQDNDGRALMGYKPSMKAYDKTRIIDFLMHHYHRGGDPVIFDESASDIAYELREKLQKSLEKNKRRAENLPNSCGFKSLEAKINLLKSQIESIDEAL